MTFVLMGKKLQWSRFGRAASEDDALRPGCLALGLRWMFRPKAARHVRGTYELRVEGEVVSAAVDRGEIEVSTGPAKNPNLVIEVLDRAMGPAMIEGRMRANDAKMSEHLRFEGDRTRSRTSADLRDGSRPGGGRGRVATRLVSAV